MPSAETRERAASTSTTSLKPDRSTRGRACRSRSRNRFDVLFARPIPSRPPAASSARSRASLLSWLFTGVEEGAAHRIVVADVALAHHDLEDVRLAVGGAEHLSARPQVSPPDSADSLVEPPGIELVHPLPIAVEATRPVVERERVVAAQVFDVHHFEPAALAPVDRLGEAGNPAAGEDVLADPELGVAHADVADEVDHPEPARLEILGVGANHLRKLVAPRVLERADREQLVELPRHLAEIALEHLDLAFEAAAPDLGAYFLDLLGGGVDAGADRPVLLPGVEEQVAPAAADVGEGIATLEQDLAAHVVHLGDLRFLERLGCVGEPGAGVGHAHFVEPFAVEILAGPVVEAGVRFRLRDRRVAADELVPPVAHLDEESRHAVEAGVAEKQHAPCGAAVADEDGHVRRALAVLPGRAVGEDDAETDLGLRADLLHCLLELRVHDLSGCRCARRDLDSFLLQIEAAGGRRGKMLPVAAAVLLVSGARLARPAFE